MIEFGFATFKRDYYEEIELAKSLGFGFFQLWFHNGRMCADTLAEPREIAIKEAAFPIIIHAVFNMPDYEKYGGQLLDLAGYFGHSEVIIHPLCNTEPIDAGTIFKFKNKTEAISKKISERGIKLFLENNSVIGGFFMIFTKIIPNYSGRIILEACDTVEDVKKSKAVLDNLFSPQQSPLPTNPSRICVENQRKCPLWRSIEMSPFAQKPIEMSLCKRGAFKALIIKHCFYFFDQQWFVFPNDVDGRVQVDADKNCIARSGLNFCFR